MVSFLESALKLKKEGNDYFKKGNLSKAKGRYTKVFAYTKALTGGLNKGGDAMVDM